MEWNLYIARDYEYKNHVIVFLTDKVYYYYYYYYYYQVQKKFNKNIPQAFYKIIHTCIKNTCVYMSMSSSFSRQFDMVG